MADFNALFNGFTGIKAGIIGDVMVDTYLWGNVDRISPEAPVPVVRLKQKEYRIGGAGNVALNCKAMGASVTLLTVTGDDNDGQVLKTLFEDNGISTSGMVASASRITTNKTRIISRSQQMMRLDAEDTHDLNENEERSLLDKLDAYLLHEKPQVIILEDYNKGVLTEYVIREVVARCKAHNVLIAVDPKKKNFFAYKGVDIFKPNLKEVREALHAGNEQVNLASLQQLHVLLEKELGHAVSFITLSERGVFFQKGNNGEIIPSHIRSIADVSGAGDTVIAVASLVYALTKDTKLMAETANIAGGLVCEEVGTAAINKEKLLRECERLLG